MRVVSLLPAATDILTALGAADLLAGITHECDAPGLAPSISRVTSSVIDGSATAAAIDAGVSALSAAGEPLFRLDEPLIAQACPDLIITQALCDVCAVSEDDVRAMANRMDAPPRILTLGANTLDGVLDDIGAVSAAVDRADDGLELVFGLRSRMRSVHQALKAARAPRPRVAVIEWTDPVYAAGHWTPDVVRRAGGIDVLATAGVHSTRRSVDSVREASPEVVLFAPCGFGLERAAREGRALLDSPQWEWARSLAVWALDATAILSRPGPRLVEGIEVMARIFNPTCFPPLGSGQAVRLV